MKISHKLCVRMDRTCLYHHDGLQRGNDKRACMLWYLPTTLSLICTEAYVIATTRHSAQMILVLVDDVGRTKKVNPCILVPPANSCNIFKNPIAILQIIKNTFHFKSINN